jgi:plastocyanin
MKRTNISGLVTLLVLFAAIFFILQPRSVSNAPAPRVDSEAPGKLREMIEPPDLAIPKETFAEEAAPEEVVAEKIDRKEKSPAFAPAPAEPVVNAGPIPQFKAWTTRYLDSTPQERPALEQEGINLATSRRPAFKNLISEDPREAIAQAVPMVVRQKLPAAVVNLLEERISGIGRLELQVGLPESDSSEPIYQRVAKIKEREWRAYVYGRRSMETTLEKTMMNGVGMDPVLALNESPVRPLEVGEIPDPTKEVVKLRHDSGKSVPVELEPVEARSAIGPETLAIEAGSKIIYPCCNGHISGQVEEILLAFGSTGGPTSATSALPVTRTNSTGARKLLYMRAIFPDQLDESQSEQEALTACKQLDDFYREASYGKVSFQSTVTPVIMLPRTEAYYRRSFELGSDTSSSIMNDAKPIARDMGYTPEDYHHTVLIYTGGAGAAGTSSFLGLATSNGGNVWLRTPDLGVFIHEVGHNLGAAHSNFWNTGGESIIGKGQNTERGHQRDVMGNAFSQGDLNANQKQILEWLTPETYYPVKSSGLYRIHQLDQSNLDPNLRYAIEIPKDSEREYWVEFRQKQNSFPWYANGASINWSRWGNAGTFGSGGGTQLLDMTPGTADDRDDSALVIGKTFSDYEADIHITPVGKGGTIPESLDVQVHIGTAAGNAPPTLVIAPSATSIAAGDSVTFTATSTDPNGDTLAYHWDFGDKQPSPFFGPTFSTDNNATQTKSFPTAGWYAVQCTVSDMKGGVIRDTVLIQVGTPTTFYISGTVTDSLGAPVYDARVQNGRFLPANYRGASTDSDGQYYITNQAPATSLAGNYTVAASAPGYSFAPAGFTNPVAVGPNQTGINFTATEAILVSMEVIDGNAKEGEDGATFRLKRKGSTTAAQTVYLNFSGSTETRDYRLAPAADITTVVPLKIFTIPAGQSQLDIVLSTVQDTFAEGPETLVVDLLNAGNTYNVAGTQKLTILIDDDDTTIPRVTLSVTDGEASENNISDTATFTVTRTGSTAAALNVPITISTNAPANSVDANNAINSTDYNSLPSSVTIPAGASSANIIVTPIDDSLAEGIELVQLTLLTSTSFIQTGGVTSVKITDDDTPNVSIAATDDTANETGDTAAFTISRTGSTTAPLTVHYSTGGSAFHGTDYLPLPGFVTIPAGQTSSQVLIIPINDDIGEPAEEMILQLRSGSYFYRTITPTASATISDEGDLPLVSLNIMDGFIEEKSTPDNGSFRITTTGTGAGDITVNYQISGTATSGVDFNTLPGSISIGKNTTADIALGLINDSIPEDAETVIITLLQGASYKLDQRVQATMVIRDDDAAQMVSVSSRISPITVEGRERSVFFSRRGSTTNPLTLTYSLSGTADALDYTAPSGTVTIPAAAIGAFVTITTTDDLLPEGVETIQISINPDIGTPRSYGLESQTTSLTILDDDTSGFTNTFSFAQTSTIATEGNGTISIPVNRSGAGLSSSTCSVEYAMKFTSALGSGVDFEMPAGSLTFAPGESVKNISIQIQDDLLPEGVEAAILELRNATLADIGINAGRTTVFIRDNEPRITIEAIDPFAYESSDSAQLRISREGTTTGPLVVPITVSGTAVSGTDFAALPPSVTIPAGAASVTLNILPLANPAANTPRTVQVSTGLSGNSLPGSRSVATVMLGDAESDDPPFLHLISPLGNSPGVPASVTLNIEALAGDDTPATLTTSWTQLSGPGIVTFENASIPSTGANFSLPGAYTLRLTANDGVQSTTLDLPITVGTALQPWVNSNIGVTTYPGSALEQNGSVSLSGLGVTFAGTRDQFFFRHRELSGDGEIIARVRNVQAASTLSRIGVMIRETAAADSKMAAMHLAPRASNSTNTNLSSYQRRTDTSIVDVNTNGVVPSSWVRLTRSGNVFTAYDSPDGVNWNQRGQDTITIANNVLVGISMTSATTDLTLAEVDSVRIIGTPENNGPIVDAGLAASVDSGIALPLAGSFTDDALPNSPGAVVTNWSVVSGPGTTTFADPSDRLTSVSFSAPGTYTLRLQANDGEVITSDTVVITATGTAVPAITVAATGPTANESALSPGEFTITRPNSSGSLTLNFALSGSATAATDYVSPGSSITLPDGVATATIPITPLADTVAEGTESITLSISPAAGYALGSPSSATISLLDIPFDDWRFQQFGAEANNLAVAGSMIDSDSDGLDNLLEYAFGLNPRAFDNTSNVTNVPNGILTARGTPVIYSEPTPNGQDFRVIFVRQKSAASSGVTYIPQFSSDMTDWETSTAVPTVIATDGEVEAVSIRYPFFVNGKKARFFRVGVTLN